METTAGKMMMETAVGMDQCSWVSAGVGAVVGISAEKEQKVDPDRNIDNGKK